MCAGKPAQGTPGSVVQSWQGSGLGLPASGAATGTWPSSGMWRGVVHTPEHLALFQTPRCGRCGTGVCTTPRRAAAQVELGGQRIKLREDAMADDIMQARRTYEGPNGPVRYYSLRALSERGI